MKWPKILSGRKQNASLAKTVRTSFVISATFHAVLLLTATVFVIGHIFFNKESTFVGQPPPMKSYEPRKLEFRVKVSKQQRSSSRPSMAPRMVSTRPSNLSLPEIKMDAKVVKTRFQPKFKAFSGTGLGAGLGTGYGEGGFGDGVSNIKFFGIRAQGQFVAILVDVSVSMVEDEKGGPKGYDRVRLRLNQVVDALAEGTMFNVIVFADGCSTFETNMVPAVDNNKTKAKQFLRGFNTEGNYGLTSGNYQPPNDLGLAAAGGTTRMDLALDAAFEQGADTILIISDGLPEVKKAVTPEQVRAHSAQVQSWYAQNADAIRQWDAQNANQGGANATRVWIPPTPARPPTKAGLKEGQQPDPGAPAIPGHWEVRTDHNRPMRPHPPMLEPGKWSLNDFIQHLKLLHEELYVKRGKKLPVIHAIGYAIDKEGGAFLQALAQQYKGRYQRVAKIE